MTIPLWVCASNLGFTPSTLSLVMELVSGSNYGRYKVFRNVEARFQQLVAEGKDPNVMTINGHLLLKENQFEKSVVTLKRALRVGYPNFELRPSCQLYLAKSLMSLDRETEAMNLLDELANDGLTDVHKAFASVFKRENPARARQHLYEAALGEPELYRKLSELAIEDAATSSSPREPFERLAYEWSRLADPRSHH
ncbi:hypothetical protein CDD80_6518 [Ophiocordyceps camponoti-rufipedis]|uniref:Uncharacterized protein n=1 Tax=Ophiocordyceps camponoti-rufipedis TaxID=2004952 RepID=A0A2C5YRV7_9HYPO|nr:hypothetical protein CDD80_6518 [Ophiocordyceps camponoti-rufipedis]